MMNGSIHFGSYTWLLKVVIEILSRFPRCLLETVAKVSVMWGEHDMTAVSYTDLPVCFMDI